MWRSSVSFLLLRLGVALRVCSSFDSAFVVVLFVVGSASRWCVVVYRFIGAILVA